MLLADLILVTHFAFVAFIVGGLLTIWIGALVGWRWVRNFRFRVFHLAAIAFVAAEALIGMACPLTVWEDSLRGTHTQTSFLARWLHQVLFYDFPDWVFTLAYVAFLLVVVATFWLIPPRFLHRG